MKKRRVPRRRALKVNVPFSSIKSVEKPLHELTTDQADKLETIHQICGHLQDERSGRQTTLEDFQRSFMCEPHPDQEITCWCRIALAYQKFTRANQPDTRKEAQKILYTLIVISAGMDQRILAEHLHAELKQCFYNPTEQS